jgi:predicted RNase H-like HicB family nuclease
LKPCNLFREPAEPLSLKERAEPDPTGFANFPGRGIILFEGIGTMIFHVTMERAEDGWIVAECPALPGCVSQGKDEKEALENIKEAITAWLWAEDQKAAATLRQEPGQQEIVVAV